MESLSPLKPIPPSPDGRRGVSRRDAIIGAVAPLVGVTPAGAAGLDRLVIVDGWVVKQSELRTR